MSWSKNCIISKISRTAEACGDNPVEETLTIEATFQIKNAKHYVPVVTLSVNDNFIFFGKQSKNFIEQYIGTNI